MPNLTDPLGTTKQTLDQHHAQAIQQEGILRKMHMEGVDYYVHGLRKAAAKAQRS